MSADHSCLSGEGEYTKFGKLWTRRRYTETVFEIIEYFISNHIGVAEVDGKKVKFGDPWWYAYSNKIPRGGSYSVRMDKAFYGGGSEVSFTIACLTAQHTRWGAGGVDLETPFLALRMWELMPVRERIGLITTFYRGDE
jgi:hypothetical protein